MSLKTSFKKWREERKLYRERKKAFFRKYGSSLSTGYGWLPFPPQFYYTHSEEEIAQATTELLDELEELLHKAAREYEEQERLRAEQEALKKQKPPFWKKWKKNKKP